MRKSLFILAAVLAFAAFTLPCPTVSAQTYGLGGQTINIAVVPTSAATALGDSLTDIHELIKIFEKATGDTLTAAHAQLLAKILLAARGDSLTAAHTQLLAKALLAARGDSLTATHTQLLAKILALARADTVTAVHEKLSAVQASVNALNASLGVFREQADTAVNVTALADSETTVLNLRTANTRYVLRGLVLKSADPGANTVTVRLYGFVNDAFVAIDTFAITTSNYTTYFKLNDLFEAQQIHGDNIMVTVQTDAGTAAVTGQYGYAKTNN